MFTVKVPAWHRLGTVLEDAPSLDVALKVAGLDWEVESRPIFYEIPDDYGLELLGESKPELREIPGFKVNVRTTDDAPLGVVTDSYKTAQNRKNLDALAPSIDAGDLVLETAGSLMNGRRCWILARYDDNLDVRPGDKIVPYLLIAWGHDGKMAVRIINTPIRVVCANTMHAAGARETGDFDSFRDQNNISIAHVGDIDKKVEAAVQAVQIARADFRNTIDVYRAMAGKPVDVQTVRDFTREMFDADYIKAKALVKKLQARALTEEVVKQAEFATKIGELELLIQDREANPNYTERAVVESFEAGPGHELAGSTVYGLMNACTDYIDHTRSKSDEASLKSSWFGSGAGLRKKAFDGAFALLN
jgi:phage/plasmid-like protein (TIGR03299 family)